MVDTLAIDPKHQISDGVGVLISTTPADGLTLLGAHPDHAGLTRDLCQAEGVVHVGRPVAPVRIEVGPGGGLNCDGVGHVLCFVPLIIRAEVGGSGGLVDSAPTGSLPEFVLCCQDDVSSDDPKGTDRLPGNVQHESRHNDLKHGLAMVGCRAGLSEGFHDQSRSEMFHTPQVPASGAGVRISVPAATSALAAAERAIMALC